MVNAPVYPFWIAQKPSSAVVIVILASMQPSSSAVGSISTCSPILAAVIETGTVVTGIDRVAPVSTTLSSFISNIGSFAVRSDATTAYDVASNRLSSALSTLQSTNIV